MVIMKVGGGFIFKYLYKSDTSPDLSLRSQKTKGKFSSPTLYNIILQI